MSSGFGRGPVPGGLPSAGPEFSPRTARLRLRCGRASGKEWRLSALRVEVGRADPPDYAPDIDLTPCELGSDYAVSRRHAELYWAEGRLWLADLGSRNGTLLNGRLLTGPGPRQASDPVALQAGDVVSFANLECEVLAG
jgi:hypothetical protein